MMQKSVSKRRKMGGCIEYNKGKFYLIFKIYVKIFL